MFHFVPLKAEDFERSVLALLGGFAWKRNVDQNLSAVPIKSTQPSFSQLSLAPTEFFGEQLQQLGARDSFRMNELFDAQGGVPSRQSE